MINQYQSRVLGPTEVVDYASIVKQAYPPQAVQSEPFIGFKILCRDLNANGVNPADRLRQIDANLGFLRGKGCIIRETSMQMPDGFWVISFPVPRSQAQQQLMNLGAVLDVFERFFGIVRQDLVEVNVSGKCTLADTENCLRGVVIPTRYMPFLVTPNNSPYRLGSVVRINQMFMMFRTRWTLKNPEDMIVLAQLLSSMFH